MGTTGSGKTSFINLASKSTLDVGTNLKSCTEEVQASEQFTVDGHPVVLIDTPGFQDTSKSDMDILDSIAQSLAAWCEQGERLGGIIYVHRISDVRFSGTAIKNFKTLLAMCGTKALQNVVIVTNMWGKVTPEVGVSREQELVSNFFKPALENGALLLRHNDTTESAHDIIRDVLSKQRVTLQIQEEIIYQSKRIGETAAGKGLLRELDAQVARRLGQLQELHEMLNQIEADDGETRQELQQEVLNLREELVTLTRSGAPGKAMSSFREGVQGGIFFTLLGAGFLLWKRSIFANLFDSLFSWPPHT
ncbi:hypothetical protein BDM02DRAFT_2814789 [Thelephora ganbajun]|uniref:Uncharacterized protein n=1 Tax=Thelephora ganbajun TaxID=370292 RepID=A0ACB6ZCG5_THEGA|nr:hypothetical protein BDM02DRAFT_2814789 [Thelephora ganbajun]